MLELYNTTKQNISLQIKNIFDEDELSEESTVKEFLTVQNKLHYATHGHTASEVIYERADSDKPFMGLTTFKGDK